MARNDHLQGVKWLFATCELIICKAPNDYLQKKELVIRNDFHGADWSFARREMVMYNVRVDYLQGSN